MRTWPRRFEALLVLVVVWLVFTAGLRPLTLPDEGRYVGVAWEMLRSGDWLTPTLDGLPFFHKPPLFYWITAASLGLFGPHEWAGRVASLLGAAAAALALGLFLRRWRGEAAARDALVVLASLPLFFVGAQFANLDMLVAGCITLTVLLGAHLVLAAEDGVPAPRARLGVWAAAALGVLAKGLIGALLPALVLLVWLAVTRRLVRLQALWSWRGAVLFLVLVLPWFAAMQVRHPGFLHYFIVVQHFKRYAQGGFNNVEPVWFYPLVLLLLGLPWTLWLAAWRRRPQDVEARAPQLRWLMVCWVLVVTGFFSLPASKLVGYVLPAVPPLAVLIAELAAPARAALRWRVGAALAAGLCAGGAVALARVPAASHRQLGAELMQRRQPGDSLLFAGGYFYDLRVYARLAGPVPVVDDWHDPEIARHDNWRKELADASAFAGAAGPAVLADPSAFGVAACRPATAWVVATSAAAARWRLDALGQRVASQGDAGLWRLSPRAPGDCAASPGGD